MLADRHFNALIMAAPQPNLARLRTRLTKGHAKYRGGSRAGAQGAGAHHRRSASFFSATACCVLPSGMVKCTAQRILRIEVWECPCQKLGLSMTGVSDLTPALSHTSSFRDAGRWQIHKSIQAAHRFAADMVLNRHSLLPLPQSCTSEPPSQAKDQVDANKGTAPLKWKARLRQLLHGPAFDTGGRAFSAQRLFRECCFGSNLHQVL